MKRVIYSSEYFYNTKHSPDSTYWYFTTHGVQPGSIPKGVNVLEIRDTPNGSYFLSDKLLTYKALQEYDIKEKHP